MIAKKQTKLLIILDGWGHSDVVENNAIAQAKTPVWDKFNEQFPHSLISTSGKEVGLPGEQMGNSEVGHLNKTLPVFTMKLETAISSEIQF